MRTMSFPNAVRKDFGPSKAKRVKVQNIDDTRDYVEPSKQYN